MPDWNALPGIPYLAVVLGGTPYKRTEQVIALTQACALALAKRRRSVRAVFARPVPDGLLAPLVAECTLAYSSTLPGTLAALRSLDADVIAVDGVVSPADADALGDALAATRLGAIASFRTPLLAKRALTRAGYVAGRQGAYPMACRVDGATGYEGPLLLP